MTLQKGIQVGQALMGFGSSIASSVKSARDDADQADVDGYLEQLMRGENPEAPVAVAPQAEGPEAAGPATQQPKTKPAEIKNPKALSKAYAKWYRQQMQKESFRAMELKNQDAISQKSRVKAEGQWAQYNGMLEAGNETGAMKSAVQMINDYPNGENFEIDEKSGKLYKMEEKDGQLVRGKERPMFTRDEVSNAAKFMFDEENYNKSYVAQYRANKAHNISVLETGGKRVTDKEGNTAGYMFEYVDDKTGAPDWQFSGIGTEGSEKWHVARKRDDLRLESAGLDIEKTKAGIAETKSKTKHRGLTATAEDRKNWSPERKLAHDLATDIKAFGGDTDKAMRYVQRAKNARNLIAVQKIADELFFGEDDQADKEKFIKAATATLPEGKQKAGKGLPARERKAAQADSGDTPPKGYPDAVKAPDGKWYIVKDGKYFRVDEK